MVMNTGFEPHHGMPDFSKKIPRHGKTGGSGRVRVGSIGLPVKRVTGQKWVILSGLKTGSGQSGCGSGRVGSG